MSYIIGTLGSIHFLYEQIIPHLRSYAIIKWWELVSHIVLFGYDKCTENPGITQGLACF